MIVRRKMGTITIENKEPTIEQIKELLRLPPTKEGTEELNKRLDALGSDFNYKEKLFILFYTSPNSLCCGKVNKAGAATGGSWHGYGSWLLSQQRIKDVISQLTHSALINELEDFFRADIKRNLDVINTDRTSFRKDEEYNFTRDNGEQITIEKIKDKPIYELNKKQRDSIADFEYDKNGDAHPVIESRTQARKNLLTYYQILTKEKLKADQNKNDTETVVTLEAIKDKVTAKVALIQKNDQDALLAGDFFDTMSDIDEEA